MLQVEILTTYKKKLGHGVFVSERSSKASIDVFSKALVALGYLTEENLQALQVYEQFLPQPDFIIYVRVSPKEALKRIQERGRESEATITLDYLQEIEKHYLNWINNTSTPVLVIDGEQEIHQVQQDLLKALQQILKKA